MIKKFNQFNEGLYDPELKKELQHLIGKHIQLIHMEDQYGVDPGTIGVVYNIDDINNIFVQWENGRMLAMIPEVDQYRILSDEEVSKYKASKKFNL